MTDLTCFKAYDVRGEIGVNIDDDVAYRIGRAVAQHFSAKSVVIGFDARETSPAFAAAVARGTMDAGAWSCGMVAGLIHDVPSCQALVDEIMGEANEIIGARLAKFAS